MKTMSEGGVFLQKYMIENLGKYNGYYFFFTGENLFDNNFAV
jgi:hypothetical protein